MGIGNLSSIIKTSSATPSTGLLVTPEVQQQQQQQLFINHNSNFNQQTAQLQLQTNQQQGSQQIFFNTIPQNLQLNPQPKVVIQVGVYNIYLSYIIVEIIENYVL